MQTKLVLGKWMLFGGRIFAFSSSKLKVPSSKFLRVRTCTPPIVDTLPCSYKEMCDLSPTSISSPRRLQCTITAIKFAMHEEGTKSAASFPNIVADKDSSSFTVGSNSQTSSPTSQVAIARLIAVVGSVNVSDRKSWRPFKGIPNPV